MKRLLKVTALTGLLTLLRMAMGFVIAKVVAVETGPTGLAMLGQVQSMVNSLNGLINAPAGAGVVRFTAEQHKDGFEACARWWRASVRWVLAIFLVVTPIVIILSDDIASWLLKDEGMAWVVIVATSLLPLAAIGTLFNSVLNGQQNYRRFVGLGMASSVISAVVMLSMIMLADIEGALLAAAAQTALAGVVMLTTNLSQQWMRLSYWFGAVDREAMKVIGGYVLMALTTALTVPISQMMVRTVLIEQVGWQGAGLWQAVWKISEVYLGVITMALATYFLPRLSSLVGVATIVSEIRRTTLIVLPVVTTLALLVYLSRDLIISLLFTEAFRDSRELFAVQLCGDVIKIVSWLYAYPMLSRGAVKWYVGSELVFSVAFVVFAYVLILNLGVAGATWAYLLTYCLYFVFGYSFVRYFAR